VELVGWLTKKDGCNRPLNREIGASLMSIISKAILFWILYSIIISICVGWALTVFPLQTGKPVRVESLQ
jgi:hypothetical protein